MPPTKVPATQRFFQPEISKIYWLPTIASAALAATRAEINAGKDVTDEVADIAGFNTAAGMIAVPDMGTRFTRQIPGRTTADASSLTCYGSQDGNDIRKVLTRLQRGFLLFADLGDVAALPADIFPVQVTSIGKLRSVGDNAFRQQVAFAVTGVPAEDYALPALA